MAPMSCPNCSESIDDTSTECVNCGLILAKWRERNAATSESAVAPSSGPAQGGLPEAPQQFSARIKTTKYKPKSDISELKWPLYLIWVGGAIVTLALFSSLPGPWTTKPTPVTTTELSALTLAPGYYEVSGAEMDMQKRYYRVFYDGGSFFSTTSPFQRRTPIGPAPQDVDSVKITEVQLWIADQRYNCIWYVREAGITSAITRSFPANYKVEDVTPDIEAITSASEYSECSKIAVVRTASRVGTSSGLLLMMIGGPILSIGLITRFMQKA